MTQDYKHEPVRSRNEPFAQRMSTRIWSEKSASDNPYIASSALCHGYDLFELMQKRSFVDVFFLLFSGELPSPSQAQLLQELMIALINPGPRHPATRAAMNVGVGKTDPLHILPIASALLGGQYWGGGEVEKAMVLFQEHQASDPVQFAARNLQDHAELELNAELPAMPGFGQRFGGIELMAKRLADQLCSLDAAGPALKWGNSVATAIEPQHMGWLTTGVAAAVFCDLGFSARMGACLFQLLSSPGLVAHGLEMAGKPILAMPFVSDENYVVER